MNRSILSQAVASDIRAEPFPHLHLTAGLTPEHYAAIDRAFPPMAAFPAAGRARQNSALRLSPDQSVGFGPLSDLVRYHVSPDFWQDVLRVLGSHIRAAYPKLEQDLGKRLEDASVGVRREGASEDILLDCQPSINTPVTEVSRVRGVHIDNHKKLFNSLLYMRMEGDESNGGDLALHRAIRPLTFGVGDDRYAVPDDQTKQVGVVPYRANTLLLFLNSASSLHSVTPRSVTPYPRRYINFLAHTRVPLFPEMRVAESSQAASKDASRIRSLFSGRWRAAFR
jgi:hypothetical protein